MSGSGISWPSASLHLAPDRQPCQHPTTPSFYTPDALPVAQPVKRVYVCFMGYISALTYYLLLLIIALLITMAFIGGVGHMASAARTNKAYTVEPRFIELG